MKKYFLLPVLEYVEDIYNTFLAATSEELKNAAQKLKELTPLPMNSMLQKQPRAEAIAKRLERSKMEIIDVPPTTPGTIYKLCNIALNK